METTCGVSFQEKKKKTDVAFFLFFIYLFIYLFFFFGGGVVTFLAVLLMVYTFCNLFILFGFARVCNHVTDFNARNKYLMSKLLQQGYRYQKRRKTVSKFYRTHYELFKFNVGLNAFYMSAIRNQNFGDLVTYRK